MLLLIYHSTGSMERIYTLCRILSWQGTRVYREGKIYSEFLFRSKYNLWTLGKVGKLQAAGSMVQFKLRVAFDHLTIGSFVLRSRRQSFYEPSKAGSDRKQSVKDL